MSYHDELHVWNDNSLVGFLWRDQASPQGIGFRYAENWLERGFAVSQKLPIGKKEWRAEAGSLAHTFFANLLPESGARERIVRDLKIPDTDFDLLRAIGGECAGALSILPVEKTPSRNYDYDPMDETGLLRLVARRGQPARGYSEKNRPRLSLAGAQDKTPVLYENGRYFLPLGESPSSHILKFEIPDYSNIPAYEYYTTLLARGAGIRTIDIDFDLAGDRSFVRVKRYDRFRDEANRLRRIHQEDFCQAMGIGYQYKYQKNGGPSFADCYRLLQSVSTEPALDSQSLLDWQIFNVLAGNSDGHAKNLSLLYSSGQVRLAPFYDLVCTRAIARIDRHLAFSVGGQSDPHLVNKPYWEAEASACGVKPSFLVSKVNAMSKSLLEGLSDCRKTFEAAHGNYPALRRVNQVVEKGVWNWGRIGRSIGRSRTKLE